MLSLHLRPFCRFCHVSYTTTTIFVSGYCSKTIERKSSVVSNFDRIRPKPLEEPALVKLKSERDLEKLFQLFKANAHNRLVIENRFAFEDTVSRLAGAKRFDYIEHLLEHQKALPQGRREGFVIRIIMLYGKAGMVDQAVKTFLDMHLFGCQRTVKSFNAALKVLTQTLDLQVIETFLSHNSSGIVVDIFSVNIIIKAYCDMDILDKAYLVMVEMEKMEIRPDVITYTTLISAYYKHNRCEIGNGLWNRMVIRRCLPNLATFNVRIQYLVNRKRAWEANSLMLRMQCIGIMPDEVTYNLVIKGFCQANYLEMAKRVYSALLGKCHKPNVKIYQTLIHYLCEAKDFKMSCALCKDCMNKNRFPDVHTIYKLLEGLTKNEMIDEARTIVMFARRRVPPLSQDHLRAFQSILGNKYGVGIFMEN